MAYVVEFHIVDHPASRPEWTMVVRASSREAALVAALPFSSGAVAVVIR